jgi:putative ABC transport system permease protein
MFNYNLRLAIRNIIRRKEYTLINLIGLTLSMSILILISLWIRHEMSYDKFNLNYSRIYRVVSGNPADKESFAGTPAPLGPLMKSNWPEIKDYCRIAIHATVVHCNQKAFNEKRFALADSSFFSIFSLTLVSGRKEDLGKKSNSIFLSESTAKRYFGDKDPMGESLILYDTIPFEITGVFKDIPSNSHIHFDLVGPFERFITQNDWGGWNYYTYILFGGTQDLSKFKQKSIDWSAQFAPENKEMFKSLYYQSITDIHSQYNRYNPEPSIEKKNLVIALSVAFLILFIACINFTNLSNAQSVKRSKEIAIRKIEGESLQRIRVSLMAETFTMVLIAFLLSIIIVNNVIPLLNNFLETKIDFHLTDPFLFFSSLGVVLLTSLLAGLYPAFVLSSVKPIDIFRPTNQLKGNYAFRNILVIFQFTISIGIIISIFIINNQIKFMRSKDLGMNIENIVNIDLQGITPTKKKLLKDEFLKKPEVSNASINSYIPTEQNEHWGGIGLTEKSADGTSEDIGLWIIFADKDFFKTMRIKIVDGIEMINNIDEHKFPGASPELVPFVLNDMTAGLVKEGKIVGKEFSFFETRKAKIIAISQNFNFRSLHHKLEPTAIIINNSGRQISLRLSSKDIAASMASLRATWKRIIPDLPFEYYFLEDDFNHLYNSEMKTSTILISAGLISIFLSCMGILGIVSFSCKRRTKEIGLRKANGAQTLEIMLLLSSDYSTWVLIAFIIACPIVWIALHRWLENFAYRIAINAGTFLFAGAIVMALMFIIVSWQSRKAANLNPIEALRYE